MALKSSIVSKIFFFARGIALVDFEKQNFGSSEPPLFDGRNTLHELNIALSGIIYFMFDERGRHFNLITNLFGAAGMCFFCSYCNKSFRYVNQHKYARTCESCYVSPACRNAQVEMIECVVCGRQFFGHECFANHKRNGSYKKNNKKVCEVVRLCGNCTKVVNVYQPKHECGIGFCRTCKKRHGFNDLCFVRPGGVDTRGKKINIFIFFTIMRHVKTHHMAKARAFMYLICASRIKYARIASTLTTYK